MFYRYDTEQTGKNTKFVNRGQLPIFGSVNGVIVRALREIVPKGRYSSLKWKTNFDTDLAKIGFDRSAIVIDLKPSAEGNLSLYKIENIFGNSASGWTPMMFHLKALFVDAEGGKEKKKHFSLNLDKCTDIFTFHHVYNGYIENGRVEGLWMPPRPSSTNSAMLWPDTMDYFIECRREILGTK